MDLVGNELAYGAVVGMSATGLTLSNDADSARFTASLDGRVVASCFYRYRDDVWLFTHTEVDTDYEGKGIGSALARFALDEVRSSGGTVVPICPFIRAYIDRHPEYADLVNSVVWDRIKASQAKREETSGDLR